MGMVSSVGSAETAAVQERVTAAGESKMLWVAPTKVNAGRIGWQVNLYWAGKEGAVSSPRLSQYPNALPLLYYFYRVRNMKPDFAQYGFAHQQQLIMAFIGGSQAHGAKLGATDDTDWYGLYIPPSDKVLGLEREEHFVFTTGGKFGGNGPSDVDVCLYTLIKWAGLAAKGNPSALHFLFAPLEFTTETWKRVAARPEIFLAKGHVKPFLGFADDQMKRLLGQKGQKNIHRAELERTHGYDTKYAMHVIRLYGEAKELMKDGHITLPRPNRDELVEVRKGKYSLAQIQELGMQLESEALAAQSTSPLPDRVDRDAISKLLADIHLQVWNAR
jgi:predicted nucleotidyltransferase